MNRHSLVFNVTLFFVFLMSVINILLFIQYRMEYNQYRDDLAKRFHKSERMMDMGHRDGIPEEEAKQRVYEINNVEIIHEPADLESAEIISQEKHNIIYVKSGIAYYVLDDPRRGDVVYFRYANYGFLGTHLIIFALLINLSVLLFYLYVLKRLKPLKVLKKNIVHFAQGDANIISSSDGKDEIAEVSKEFHNMTKKMQVLQDSRKLFLRNIMHELKTPITKGKLITDLMQDPKNQERLKRIFSRFEYLLGEFTKIERVTSNAMDFHKKKYRTVDIIDNAFDLLLLDDTSDIDVQVTSNLEIEADYELMSIALKNLIDNAMKYGKGKSKIIVNQKSIIVESTGDKLEDISFEKAFNRKYEGSEQGLGLGLYITQNIVSKHGYTFSYEHHEGKNSFILYC